MEKPIKEKKALEYYYLNPTNWSREDIENPKPLNSNDDEDDLIGFQNQIVVGDISVTSKGLSLNTCKKQIKGLLKDKSIKNYLNIYSKQKFIKPDYID